MLLKFSEAEQKQQYHPGVSPQRLLTLVELRKPEHKDWYRTVDKTELHQVLSGMVPTGDGVGRAAVGAARTAAVAASERLGVLRNKEELMLCLATR